MSAAAVLARLQAAGLHLAVRPDGTVRLTATSAPPPELLAEASRHRDGIAALLREREERPRLAAALLVAAQRGAAAVAAGPVDDMETGEAAAIRELQRWPRPTRRNGIAR